MTDIVERVARAIRQKPLIQYVNDDCSRAHVLVDGGEIFSGTVEECREFVRLYPARAAILETLAAARLPTHAVRKELNRVLDDYDGMGGVVDDMWIAGMDKLAEEIGDE